MSHFQEKHHAAVLKAAFSKLKPGDILLTDAGSGLNTLVQVLTDIPAGHAMLYTGHTYRRYAGKKHYVIDHPPLKERSALAHFEDSKVIRVIGIHCKKLSDAQRKVMMDFARSLTGQVGYNGGMLMLQGLRAILRSVDDRLLTGKAMTAKELKTAIIKKLYGERQAVDSTVLKYLNRWINGTTEYDRSLTCSAAVAVAHEIVGAPITTMTARTVGTQDIWRAMQHKPHRYKKAFDIKFGATNFDKAVKKLNKVGAQLQKKGMSTNTFR